jgi:hypothetical protein
VRVGDPVPSRLAIATTIARLIRVHEAVRYMRALAPIVMA